MQNFYCRTVYNLGFSGEDSGLPAEVSVRLLEIYLFLQEKQFLKFIPIVIAMIQIKLDHMMQLDDLDDLFKYLSNGVFITDILMNESDCDRLFKSILEDLEVKNNY